eukprot:5792149-Amphidinium_carterae.1
MAFGLVHTCMFNLVWSGFKSAKLKLVILEEVNAKPETLASCATCVTYVHMQGGQRGSSVIGVVLIASVRVLCGFASTP